VTGRYFVFSDRKGRASRQGMPGSRPPAKPWPTRIF